MKRTNKISRRGYSRFSSNLGREARVFAMATFGILTSAFLVLTMAPLAEQKANATTTNSEVSVGVEEVLSLRILKYDEEQHDWVDTSELSTTVRNGYFAAESVRVVASTNGSGGYTLSLSDVDNDTALTSTTVTDTIPALTSSVTVADVTDSTNLFPQEKWGYSWAKGETASLAFSPIPTNNAAASAKQKDVTNGVGANTYTFSMGVKVGEETPAETYQDQVMFTVVGNPSPTSPLFFRTTYMQDFTPQICNTVDTPVYNASSVSDENGYNYTSGGNIVPSTRVKDRRDGQDYIVRKLADGHCWMVESLRYGAAVDTQTTPSTTPEKRPYVSSDAALSASGFNDTKMADLTTSRIITGISGQTGVDGNSAFSDNVEYFTEPYIAINAANTTDEVSGTGMRYGALYNYCAATGGTACTASGTTPTVSSSICPTNWTLPDFDAQVGTTVGTNASYNNLTAAYHITVNTEAGVNAILGSPLSFPRSGVFGDGALWSRSASGYGYYWSSRPSGGVNAYVLYFYGTASIGQGNNTRRGGLAVRCVVAS